MHGELLQYVMIIVILLVIGVPLAASKIKLPQQLKFEMVKSEDLTPAQAQFFSAQDSQLHNLGYAPAFTYRVTNMIGRNLLRTYFSPSDPARCTVTLLSIGPSTSQQIYVEFTTQYADDTILETRNANISGGFKRRPHCLLQNYPGLHNLAELKRYHDAKARTLLSHAPVFVAGNQFFAEFQRLHVDYCNFQTENKLLRFDAATGTYRGTLKIALRGLQNFVNPFADNFTVTRLAVGLILGAGIPLLVVLKLPLLAGWLASTLNVPYASAASTLVLGSYAIAGIVIGCLFSQKIFIWAFMLAFLPAALFSVDSRAFQFSMMTAVIAELTFRARAISRRLV